MINANSIKDRLKNLAKQDGSTMQEKLVTYAIERTIYRLSISPYNERFTLKGGIFLYALFDKQFSRVTRDIDLLGQYISNDINEISNVFREIFSISCDDALMFDLNSLSVDSITEFKEYHGVNVNIIAFLDRTKIPVSIDVGFGDIVYPNRIKMEFPSLLSMEEPIVYAYSLYSAIAEKFEAIVSLGYINSRYKDYYDIYVLASEFNLLGELLKEAVVETFSHRNTGFKDMVVFEKTFINDSLRESRWNAFIKKKKAMINLTFKETMSTIEILLEPIVDSINNNTEFLLNWDSLNKKWK